MPQPKPHLSRPHLCPCTFVLLILRQALHTGHEDVIIAQELSQQQAAEAVTKALVPCGICG